MEKIQEIKTIVDDIIQSKIDDRGRFIKRLETILEGKGLEHNLASWVAVLCEDISSASYSKGWSACEEFYVNGKINN